MRRDYEWTLDDVREAHRRARFKRLEENEARNSAVAMELEYWTRELVKNFPELEDKTHKVYQANIQFAVEIQRCFVVGPQIETRFFPEARMLVWHKGRSGKVLKNCVAYPCEAIVPRITEVRLADAKKAV